MVRGALLLAVGTILVGCGGSCGTHTIGGTDLEATSNITGRTYDVDGRYPESCGARRGTLVSAIGDAMELWFRPTARPSDKEAIVTDYVGLTFEVPATAFVEGAVFGVDDALVSRGCMEDNLHGCLSDYAAPLTEARVELVAFSACDEVGGAAWVATVDWDLTWGDPDGDAPWFASSGTDRVDVIVGGDCPVEGT